MISITGHAGYVPLYRIERTNIADQHGKRGRNETAVPGRDENLITMACEAAETAVNRADTDAADLSAIYSASITDRFAEHGLAAHVAYRLGRTGDVRTSDLRGTYRASANALLNACDFVDSGGGAALVVAADVMPATPDGDDSQTAGAGAGALVLEEDPSSPVADIVGRSTETTGFVERHRVHGEEAIGGDATFEGNHAADAMAQVRSRTVTDLDADGVDCGVVSVPNQKWARGALGNGVERYSTFSETGDVGTASFYLDLAHLIEEAGGGEHALAVEYGSGGADAIALSVEDSNPDEGLTVSKQLQSKEYVTYAKHLEYREPVDYQGVQMG